MSRPRKSLNCEYCPGKRECFVQRHLSDDARQTVDTRRSTCELQRGEILYHAGDRTRGIWVVCSGRVKTYVLTEEGKSLITAMAGPGDIVGHGDYINGRNHREYAESLETTVMALLDTETIRALLNQESGLSQALLARLAKELRDAETLAVKIAYRPARDRVLDVLNELEDEADRYNPGSPYPVVVARRQEVAERAGLTVETTVRMLKQMEKEGTVAIDGRRVELRNRLREPGRVYAR